MLSPRLLLVLAALGAACAAPAAASAKAPTGPSGVKFYTPPSKLPGQDPRRPDPRAQAQGRGRAQVGRLERARALPLDERGRQGRRRLRHGRDPEGQDAQGRLADHLLGARHDRHRRPVRALARQREQPRARLHRLRLPAAQRLPQGRLRRRADRLPGPRHPGHTPVPRRRAGGPQRARHGARRPQARPAPVQEGRARRPLAGRPGRALRRVAGAEVDARAEGPRAPSPSRRSRTSPSRPG